MDVWRAVPSAGAVTAACVAGEARTLIFRSVQENLQHAVLRPLAADAFLILSEGHTGKWYNVEAQPLPPITRDHLVTIARNLGASSLTVANDSSPLLGEGVPVHHQRSMVLRFRLCLAEVKLAERARRGEATVSHDYTWVVRVRPDAHFHCKLCVPHAPLARSWGAFHRDFVAILTRDAAEIALGAPNDSIAACSSRSRAPSQRREEWCMPCLCAA